VKNPTVKGVSRNSRRNELDQTLLYCLAVIFPESLQANRNDQH